MPLEETSSSRAGRFHVRAHAAEERAGFIWMFYGDAQRRQPLFVPEELEDHSFSTFTTVYTWQTSWLNVLDNVVDPLHAVHLHANVDVQKRRPTYQAFHVTEDDGTGFRLGKVGTRADGSVGPVEGEVEFLLPNIVRLDLADIRGNLLFRVVVIPTPIDENQSWAVFARTRRATGWQRVRWWIAWWAVHRRDIPAVIAEDRAVLQSLAPISEVRLREHLVSSDLGVIYLRKQLNQAFRQSLQQA